MKTYIFHYKEKDKTYGVNFKAIDYEEAENIAKLIGCELKGEKTDEYDTKDIINNMFKNLFGDDFNEIE